MDGFELKLTPKIYFGEGSFDELFTIIPGYGDRLLLVVGKAFFIASVHYKRLSEVLAEHAIHVTMIHVNHEPEPDKIDDLIKTFDGHHFDLVLAIGGGSCIDTAKALAGLLTYNDSIYEYLEGIGRGKPYKGRRVPLVVVPTTAGTGSEMTTNAVIGLPGINGFKKSFRDDSLLPDKAIIDPGLLATCPRQVLISCAMDALTHLIESYLSTESNPITDALAISGLTAVSDGFSHIEQNVSSAHACLAYASMLGGMCLTNAGLGLVHGIVPHLGALYDIPHGVGCSILLPQVTRCNIEALLEQDPDGVAIEKYAKVGQIFSKKQAPKGKSCKALIAILDNWNHKFGPWRLSDYKLGADDVAQLASLSQLRNNPVKLDKRQIRTCLMECL